MNEIIKQQLLSCKVANIPEFNDLTTHLIIPAKKSGNGIAIREGCCYLIELQDVLLNPTDMIELHKNWNNNILPCCKYMKCECTKMVGGMIHIDGVGYDFMNNIDLSCTWSGWLPLEYINVLGEL